MNELPEVHRECSDERDPNRPSKIRGRNIQIACLFFEGIMVLYSITEMQPRRSPTEPQRCRVQHQMRHTDRTTPELCKVLHIEK